MVARRAWWGGVAAVGVAGGGRLGGLVEDHAEDGCGHAVEPFEGVDDVVVGGPAGLGDDDHAVDRTGEGDRVRHGQDGRRVDDHEVVVLAHRAAGSLAVRRPLSSSLGVDGTAPDGVHAEAVAAVEVDVGEDVSRFGAEEDVGEAGRLRDTEHVVDAGAAQVASTRATRWPAWASTTARLADVVVLPSPAIELVSWMTLIGWSSPRNWTLVRRPR